MLFPKSEELTANSKESNDDVLDGFPSDGRILAQGLASKIKALTDDEGPPLTTKVLIHKSEVQIELTRTAGDAGLSSSSADSCVLPYSYQSQVIRCDYDGHKYNHDA